MSCKCEKIMKMQRERDSLNQIEAYIDTLTDMDKDVESLLTDVAAVIPVTLNIPDEKFCDNMKALNDESCAAITSMKKHLKTAKKNLTARIKKAIKEDEAWHKAHGGKRMVSYYASAVPMSMSSYSRINIM